MRLAPEDRALVRRAAVFGLTFHPRMLAWFADDGDDALPDPATWARLQELFDEEADGYLRFRRSLLRDAAYEGLPYKLRRRLHGAVAARIEAGSWTMPEESADILSLHYLVAGDYRPAWRYASVAAKRAAEVVAYVEAARLVRARAGSGASPRGCRATQELAAVHGRMGDAWYRPADFARRPTRIRPRARLVAGDPLADADLLLKRLARRGEAREVPSRRCAGPRRLARHSKD